jgi:hypothetical protein
MIAKAWSKITEEDIRRLVEDEVPESESLDYKQELPNESPKSELDFLCDIAAFANASGGDLIYGVTEKREEGRPTAIPSGFAKLRMRGTLDETKRRLQSLVRSGISPPPCIKIDDFENLPEGPVIIIRVPPSWTAPHMVSRYSKDNLRPQFYRRHNAGNHPMDITEIRAAFNLSESYVDKIRHFRDERVSMIMRQDQTVPVLLGPPARRIIHLLPLKPVDSATVEISRLHGRAWGPSPAFPETRFRTHQFNFDGYLIQDFNPSTHKPYAYTQIFRNGGIESVRILGDYKYIDNSFEVIRIREVRDYLDLMHELEVPLPIFAMIRLIGVNSYPLLLPPKISYQGTSNDIDRDDLPLSECIFDDYDSPVENILRPAFNSLYQTAGIFGSLNYDNDGKWIGDDIAF